MPQLRALVTVTAEGSWHSIPGQLGHRGGGSKGRVALQAQFGQLNSLFLPPTFLLPCPDGEPWKCFFLVGTPSLYSHSVTTTLGLGEEFSKHTCILLFLIAFFSGQIMALFHCF